MTRHYAVFGTPIAHSLSPRIHAAFGKQTGIDLEYVAIEAGPEDFTRKLDAFAARGGLGANITLPLKRRAAELAATLGDRARRTGVANTLVRRGDGWHADNTDGSGLVGDLTLRQGLDLRGRRTLLLGSGGGARGIAPATCVAIEDSPWGVTAAHEAGIPVVGVTNMVSAETLKKAEKVVSSLERLGWQDLEGLTGSGVA